MELPVDASKLTGSPDPITVWDAKALSGFRRNPCSIYLQQCIDTMGLGSKVAQGLNAVLTSVQRLQDNPGHRLYLFCVERHCVGIMKVGVKKLFVRTRNGRLHEIDPLCVLDFYVHESAQRSGYGKALYDFMCRREGVAPCKLGYDRPSSKFLSFLQKHFGLADFVPQTNNFVVFNQYFEAAGSGSSGAQDDPQHHQQQQRRGQGMAVRSSSLSNIIGGPGQTGSSTSQQQQLQQPSSPTGAGPSFQQHLQRHSSQGGSGEFSSAQQQQQQQQPAALCGSGGAGSRRGLDSQRTAMLMMQQQQQQFETLGGGASSSTRPGAVHTAPTGSLMSSAPSRDATTAIPVSTRTAMAQEVLAASRSSMMASLGGGSNGRRAQSPTRSCVQYNILSPGDDGAANAAAVFSGGNSSSGSGRGNSFTAAVDFANSAKYGDRPMARQSGRVRNF